MGKISNAFQIELLKIATGQASAIVTSTPLSVVAVRLSTTTVDASTNGTEPTTTDYDPVDSKGDWGTPSGNPATVSNSAAIDFGTATETWDEIVGVELWTSLSGGSRIGWAMLTTPQTPQAGNPVSFPIGALDIELA